MRRCGIVPGLTVQYLCFLLQVMIESICNASEMVLCNSYGDLTIADNGQIQLEWMGGCP